MKLPILILISAGLALATDQPKAEAPKPPQITDAQKARLWRAALESQTAAVRAEKAAKALEAVQEELVKFCGGATLFVADDKGEPMCAAPKADSPKPAQK